MYLRCDVEPGEVVRDPPLGLVHVLRGPVVEHAPEDEAPDEQQGRKCHSRIHVYPQQVRNSFRRANAAASILNPATQVAKQTTDQLNCKLP